MQLIATALVTALLSVGLTLLKIRRDVADAALGSSLLTIAGAVLISMMLADKQVFLGSSRFIGFYAPLILGVLLTVLGGWLTFAFLRRYQKQRADIEQRLVKEMS